MAVEFELLPREKAHSLLRIALAQLGMTNCVAIFWSKANGHSWAVSIGPAEDRPAVLAALEATLDAEHQNPHCLQGGHLQ